MIAKEVADIPGPGNYNEARAFSEGRGFTISGRYETKHNDLPGPGSYNSDHAVNRIKSGTQTFSFSEAKRGDLVVREVSELPGPGEYNESRTFNEGRGFTIGGR